MNEPWRPARFNHFATGEKRSGDDGATRKPGPAARNQATGVAARFFSPAASGAGAAISACAGYASLLGRRGAALPARFGCASLLAHRKQRAPGTLRLRIPSRPRFAYRCITATFLPAITEEVTVMPHKPAKIGMHNRHTPVWARSAGTQACGAGLPERGKTRILAWSRDRQECVSVAVGAWRSLVARLLWEQDVAGSNPVAPTTGGHSSSVEPQPSKLMRRVRLPLPAPGTCAAPEPMRYRGRLLCREPAAE